MQDDGSRHVPPGAPDSGPETARKVMQALVRGLKPVARASGAALSFLGNALSEAGRPTEDAPGGGTPPPARDTGELQHGIPPATRGATGRIQDAWIVVASSIGEATQAAGEWIANTSLVRGINGYWDDREPFVHAITQAMDKGFQTGDIDWSSGLTIIPNNHRILIEGHTLGQSFAHAQEVAEQFGVGSLEATISWMKAYFEDLSSPGGMPLGEWSKGVYVALRDAGWTEAAARDLVTLNGSEAIEALLSGTLSALAVALSWSKQEHEHFSRAIGMLGVGSIVAANPIAGLVTVVSAIVAYRKHRLSKEALKKGVFVKLAGFSVSLLLPGPAIVTALCGMVVCVYLNRKIVAERPLAEQLTAIARASYAAARSQVARLNAAAHTVPDM
jgi:hypothetical protein